MMLRTTLRARLPAESRMPIPPPNRPASYIQLRQLRQCHVRVCLYVHAGVRLLTCKRRVGCLGAADFMMMLIMHVLSLACGCGCC